MHWLYAELFFNLKVIVTNKTIDAWHFTNSPFEQGLPCKISCWLLIHAWRCSPFIPACAPSPAKSAVFLYFYPPTFETPNQNPPSHRDGCVSPRERRCGARVNEKTTANPRNWPLIRGHLAPQGDGSLDLRCFFRAGGSSVRVWFLVLLIMQKYKRKIPIKFLMSNSRQ